MFGAAHDAHIWHHLVSQPFLERKDAAGRGE